MTTLRKASFVLLFFLIWKLSFSQQELGLHFLYDVPVSATTNPAFNYASGWNISVGSPYFNFYHPSGSLNDILKKSDDKTVIDVATVIENSVAQNLMHLDMGLETFRLQRGWGKYTVSLHHSFHSYNEIEYSKNLLKFFWEGNAQFIGDTIHIAPKQQTTAFHEIGLSGSLRAGKFTFGMGFSWLGGMGSVQTKSSKASLYTDSDVYQLELNSDFLVNSAVTDFSLLLDSIRGLGVDITYGDMFKSQYLENLSTGWNMDLGLVYEPNEKWRAAISVVDIGAITWNTKSYKYVSNGQAIYEGLDLSELINQEELNFEETLDSLQNIFDFKKSPNTFTTSLSPKLYSSIYYQHTDKLGIGALYYHHWNTLKNRGVFSIQALYDVTPNLKIGLNYNNRNGEYNSIGLQVSGKVYFLNYFLSSDRIFDIIQPYSSKHSNGRVGLYVNL